MERPTPCIDQVDIILSDESSSDTDDVGSGSKKHLNDFTIDRPAEETISEDLVIRRAQMYQEYMKSVPIPIHRGSVIPFTSWTGLANSIKLLYGQPLHYLTNILVTKWDRMRFGGEDEDTPLDSVIHPCKAEANIWLIEEVHRLTTSHRHLAKLWLSDPMPHANIDSIFPKL